MNIHRTKIASAVIDLLFMLIHFGMLWLFYTFGVKPMAVFNLFSILFYLCMLVPIYYGHLQTFAVAIYLEVVVHMSAAVYFTGWNNGFQITLIGMNVVLFFAEYLCRHLRLPHINPAPLSAVGMASYILMCVISFQRPAPYFFPERISLVLQVFWGVIVFSVMNILLYSFARLSSDTEELLFNEIGHDQLTGLPNRYDFIDRLTGMKIGRMLNQHWIAMMDIDDFKQINDTYGHNCGDYVLKEFATILSKEPSAAAVCRWGGEEFLVLGTYDRDITEGLLAAEEFRKKVETHNFVWKEQKLDITVTIGISAYQPNLTLLEWIHSADEKLYRGKRNGKNQVVLKLTESAEKMK